MQLLDARALELKTFANDIPARRKEEFKKVEKTCKLAIQDGLHYAWIDTYCVDKSSSAELSEAINSLFAWYGDSARCYTYLADVDDEEAF
ncbi:HET-domain-containing protein [Stemphylium lycopersici]|nr:het domain-containing protein [Stemphylium lycopersici]RAR01627.1 HET-domain-containing protein [Stemphylium lycopersici]